MTTHREGIFVKGLWVEDPEPGYQSTLVEEVGLTSAPLESMSFYFQSYCKDYTRDFMLCKNETNDPKHCLKEGRRVTRCAMDLIGKLKKHCDPEWKSHWNCLDMKNHHFWECRNEEKPLNDCVFNNL
ncbi:hypothetical protein HK099_007113, partial [Clydaea vesicula]